MILTLLWLSIAAPQKTIKNVEPGTVMVYREYVAKLAKCNEQLLKMASPSLLEEIKVHPLFNEKLKECSALLEQAPPPLKGI